MPALDPRNLPASEADIDFSDIEEKYQLTFNESFDNVIVVDHLPVVDSSKEEKLLTVVKKIFKAVAPLKDDGLFMPKEEDPETGKTTTQGYLFIELDTPEQAAAAIKQLNGFKMDKTHILSVHKFTDVERYATLSDTFRAPVIPAYEEREHLRSWLLDERARDEFVTFRGDEVVVSVNNKNGKPDNVFTRNKWTESYLQWSPKGTYLTTFHRQGVVLWGGPSWNKIVRFVHPGVKFADYSPNEKYLVTCSPEPINSEAVAAVNPQDNPFGPEDDDKHIAIWDLRTGALLRTFVMPQLASKSPVPLSMKEAWPHFKWSADDRYFARVVPGQMLSIYEAPGMGLLDRKSLKVEGIVNFAWSPTGGKAGRPASADAAKRGEHSLAYWTPEVANQPARVTLLSVPSKEVVRTKNLFSISDCKLYWHPSGDYLCVKADRLSKSKKTTFTNLELFWMRERSVPVETVEFKDNVVVFAWEPKGPVPRFATVSTVDPQAVQYNASGMAVNTNRNTVSFYALQGASKLKSEAAGVIGNFECVERLEKKTTNEVLWSPNGRYAVLGTVRTTSVWDLEFWDTAYELSAPNAQGRTTEFRLLASPELYGVTDVEWDPTGRYVAAYASAWRHSMENGFALYDLRGSLLGKHTFEKFKQFLWRPRPASLLSAEDKARIVKELPKLAPKFEEEDLMSESAASSAEIMKRRRLNEDWKQWRQRQAKEYAQDCEVLGKHSAAVENDTEGDANVETIEEWVEEVVEETEEVVE
ncbi:Translation initiation factor 3 subunit b [Tieghemiomyces parasiticus]|uniref:Eukaryotic translation initiation factor 3 subunit B n=1 Tax=Tieghemiomyces parasiticus TaxID=78921 RepID=A0A9W8DYH8_9FUNG|nr:Translation initiation factor 3 subunit b [Tieghemiomyces parasiticus]KAJ1929376.1 Translation initiation factor 3 subunit b [Tieghemiomyces parasiticus]